MIEFAILGVGLFVTSLVAYALVLIQGIETAAHSHAHEKREAEEVVQDSAPKVRALPPVQAA